MFIGIDLGTSGVKVVLVNAEGSVVDTQSSPISISRPKPLWSEQDPNEWWLATNTAMEALQQNQDLSGVKAIGLSGQMHGATLLDENDRVLRPAILWNDGRCAKECTELESAVPNSREITGNIMMPGFTAPKLLWVKKHEPEVFGKVSKVLLPKDYLRFCMTGVYASDMSDSAGTMWLNVAKRDWADELLTATGLSRSHMPKLYEGPEVTGYLQKDVAAKWGMQEVPVVAGAGDNAGGALGAGIHEAGQAMLSLGTSGVYFYADDKFVSNPESALHSFCHALPDAWHSMSVILSAASCLDWVANLTGFASVPEMIKSLEENDTPASNSNVIFLPYLSGERTPHNDPEAKGVFFGMDHSTSRQQLVHAVLEGVGFALADGLDAVHAKSPAPGEIMLIGGGARSEYWRQLLADIFGIPVTFGEGGDVGPALGAARLAMVPLALHSAASDYFPTPKTIATHIPDDEKHKQLSEKREVYKKLYVSLKPIFPLV